MQDRRRLSRSIGAVLAGFLFMACLSTITDIALHASGVFPPAGEPMMPFLWIVAIAYRAYYGLVSGYLTARLAPDRPVRHAVILGLVGVGVSLAGAIATWNAGPAYGPRWFSIALVVIALPCAWAGGRLYEARSLRSPGASAALRRSSTSATAQS